MIFHRVDVLPKVQKPLTEVFACVWEIEYEGYYLRSLSKSSSKNGFGQEPQKILILGHVGSYNIIRN